MNLSEAIKSTNNEQVGNEMFGLIERLYPICRSITGDGVRETLSIISEIIPVEIHEVPTGTKVFDWEVPEEWNIKDGYVETEAGDRIISFNDLNLHVLNYSTPIDLVVDYEELKNHVFTLPDQPELIPYRTSYHTRQWGFCMSHNQFESLDKQGRFHVKVDSTIKPGSLTYGEYFIKGDSPDEILVTCHICHPSLCNDNLTGIAIATYLAKLLSELPLKYSYRFLFIPGTIGSITWLSLNKDRIGNIKHGLVLTLLGDAGNFHYKKSRQGNAIIDKVVERLFKEQSLDHKLLEFSPYGYDERQFCSPGINLPVGRLSRTPHGEFPEYHSSGDNLGFVSSEKIAESYRFIATIFDRIEHTERYVNLSPFCEPQLGKRGLYKSVGGQRNQGDFQMALLWVLNLSDGEHALEDIEDRSGLSYDLIHQAAKALKEVNLLKKL